MKTLPHLFLRMQQILWCQVAKQEARRKIIRGVTKWVSARSGKSVFLVDDPVVGDRMYATWLDSAWYWAVVTAIKRKNVFNRNSTR